MGRFFSNIQIKSDQKSQEQFIKSLCKAMEQRGLVPVAEEDTSQAYLLAFSENGEWATLCSGDYESGGESVKKDVLFLAESLKTCCISTTVLDSDFAVLEMYNGISTLTDMVIVGDGDDYGFPDGSECRGNREYWKQYLIGGSTWEQISGIWDSDFTFVEDALAEMAPLLGMNPQDIVSDYNDLSSRTDKNIVALHFKKKGKKALSLDAAFKQVFGAALEPMGFQHIKVEKRSFFVRVIDGEILHIITYRQLQMRKIGYKTFEVLGGVVSLYRRTIDFTKYPESWLKPTYYYQRLAPKVDDAVMERAIQFKCDIWNTLLDSEISIRGGTLEDAFSYHTLNFFCKTENSETMLRGMKNAFQVTNQVMLSVFNQVTDLDSCVDYFYRTCIWNMELCEDMEEFNTAPRYYYSEGLLLIRTGYREDITPYTENVLATEVKLVEKGNQGLAGAKDIEDYKNRFRQRIQEQMAIRDKMLDDPELNAKALTEAERRKENNIEALKSYGLIIRK